MTQTHMLAPGDGEVRIKVEVICVNQAESLYHVVVAGKPELATALKQITKGASTNLSLKAITGPIGSDLA